MPWFDAHYTLYINHTNIKQALNKAIKEIACNSTKSSTRFYLRFLQQFIMMVYKILFSHLVTGLVCWYINVWYSRKVWGIGQVEVLGSYIFTKLMNICTVHANFHIWAHTYTAHHGEPCVLMIILCLAIMSALTQCRDLWISYIKEIWFNPIKEEQLTCECEAGNLCNPQAIATCCPHSLLGK